MCGNLGQRRSGQTSRFCRWSLGRGERQELNKFSSLNEMRGIVGPALVWPNAFYFASPASLLQLSIFFLISRFFGTCEKFLHFSRISTTNHQQETNEQKRYTEKSIRIRQSAQNNTRHTSKTSRKKTREKNENGQNKADRRFIAAHLGAYLMGTNPRHRAKNNMYRRKTGRDIVRTKSGVARAQTQNCFDSRNPL